MPAVPMGPMSMHDRRASSQSMHSDISNPSMSNMNRSSFGPQNAGRGRGFMPQPYMGSPAPNFRPNPNQGRPNMPPQFQQGPVPPGSPYQIARGSPQQSTAQPMAPGHMASHSPMHYSGHQPHLGPHNQVSIPVPSPKQPQHYPLFPSERLSPAKIPAHSENGMSASQNIVHVFRLEYSPPPEPPLPVITTIPDHNDPTFLQRLQRVRRQLLILMAQLQTMYGMPYDPNAGYYQPYYFPTYNQGPSQSPRPQYPSPFPGPPGAQMQAPYHPPATPSMIRTPSQASERPPSSLGAPQTPMQHPPAPSQTPNSAQPPVASQSANFVRPVKKSNAIKITDAQGNAVDFSKPSSSTPSTQSQAPVIVSTPSTSTPPPRAPSGQHNRVESKSVKSSEETKTAFAEQVKRQLEEDKRKQQLEEARTKPEPEISAADSKPVERSESEAAAENQIKEATVGVEKAAAVAAGDKAGEEDADGAARALQSEEDEKKRKEKEEEERIEREIAEMEAAEREEEERERAFQEKRAREKEAAAAQEKEQASKVDDDLKQQEREAEEREAARERERAGEKTEDDGDDEAKALFASLKKPALGPGASAPDSGTQTPASEDTAPESSTETATDDASQAQPIAPQARGTGSQRPKPAHLKLETNKPVERAEPTPGMQALRSARFLELKEEPKYPDGFQSPNPALNQTGQRKGRAYDKDFLLQFQSVFREKPSIDWDQRVKETLGPTDEPGSARSQSARTPSGQIGRQNSGRPSAQTQNFGGGPMGAFGGIQQSRTLPPGTTSDQRFKASMGGISGVSMPSMSGRTPSNLGMGTPGVGMSRTNSVQMMGNMGVPGSPRQSSVRGKGGNSKRDDRPRSKREEAEMAAKMPLTAHVEVTPLEKSTTGWKPTSIGQASGPSGPDPSGNMAPDMVQRKVKAALNKMTPEKFDKISDQILEIAAQSKNESDGRTLRQVIQLTFEKACDEAHWAGMYAQFCHKMLTAMSAEIRDETIKDKNGNPVVGGALFRKYLLNRCQEEFERGWQANLPDKPEGETQEAVLLSEDYYVAAAAKRRGLGLIQFIGQLYKLRMLTLRIMHECVMRLLNFEGAPDEAAVENLTTLLRAVGASMEEEDQGRQLITTYFTRIEDVLLKSDALPSRPKFMIMDLNDLRKSGWKGKDDSKGPKTIQQIHEEAEAAKARDEAERQRTSQRGPGGGGRMPQGRGDARNFSGNMPPPDYNRTNVPMEDLRRLQARGIQRQSGMSLGPGGSLGPSTLGARSGSSRRGASQLGPGSSGNTTRTNTPPVDIKKDEASTQQNAFR